LKRTITLIIIIFLTGFLNKTLAQDKGCNCIDELNQVSQLVKESKSYEVFIKGKKNIEKQKEFKDWKYLISEEIKKDQNANLYCVGYLNKYISFIKDSHNEVYIKRKNSFQKKLNYLVDIDSLTKQFESNTKSDIENIYHQGNTKIGLIKINETELIAVILESSSENWKQGNIRFRIKKNIDNWEMFEFISNGQLIYRKNVWFKNGRIYPSFWNTDNQYYFYKKHKKNIEHLSITNQVDYISIKTLQRSKKLMLEFKTFYNAVLPKLNKPYLIIDFRNNSGGSTKQADRLAKFLKRNKNLKKIYVMQNSSTTSAAEIIIWKMRKDKRVILLGENTSGRISFGYGNASISNTTDCYNFITSFSVKHTNSKLDKYEYIGLAPDMYLNLDKDWIKQVVQLIENKNLKKQIK
jgi:hypothetical protein